MGCSGLAASNPIFTLVPMKLNNVPVKAIIPVE
jgi:hypothetical protein